MYIAKKKKFSWKNPISFIYLQKESQNVIP